MSGQFNTESEPEFPPVSWGEIRDHLVERLMMDPEWTVEVEQQLEWWPTPLPMTIRVVGSGDFPDSDENWLRVAGETLIAEVGEDLGRELAGESVSSFPVGVVIYRDGALRLLTIYSFNPRNRSLLSWFHDSLLIQAVTALQLAFEWEGIDGVHITPLSHPLSGQRSGVDELCQIYGGDELGIPVDEDLSERFEAIRPFMSEAIIQNGYQPGFSNEDVDYFNFGFGADDGSGPLEDGAFDFGFGFMRGTALDLKLGPSLRITARVLPPGVTFDEAQVTYANAALCDLLDTSVFGYISGPKNEAGGSCLWATVPHATLAGWSQLGPVGFRNSVLNAVWHVTAAAQRLRRDVLGIDWQPDGSGN